MSLGLKYVVPPMYIKIYKKCIGIFKMCKDKSYQKPKKSWFVQTDIQQTLSNFATQCQPAVIRVVVDYAKYLLTLYSRVPQHIHLTTRQCLQVLQLTLLTLT